MEPRCEDCGGKLTIKEQQHNEEAHKNYVKMGGNEKLKLEMCANCWEIYCHHAMTGD
jgi:hypothetical protein